MTNSNGIRGGPTTNWWVWFGLVSWLLASALSFGAWAALDIGGVGLILMPLVMTIIALLLVYVIAARTGRAP